jgi:WD40 repeat protein
VKDLLAVGRQVAEGLGAAHGKGILHRDVKPANLLVRKDESGWNVKLIDFGLALRRDADSETVRKMAQGGTLVGSSIAGTLDYGAPEQMGRLAGVSVGAYSDIYGFGKTCCLALFKTTQPLPRHWQSVPHDLALLLEQCLEEAPKQRPPDFTVVLKRLSNLCPTESDTQIPQEADNRTASTVLASDVEKEETSIARTQPRKRRRFRLKVVVATGLLTIPVVLLFAWGLKGEVSTANKANSTPDIESSQPAGEVRRLTHYGRWGYCFTAVSFSPDGKHAYACCMGDTAIHIFNVQTGTEERSFKLNTQDVESADFSSDGRLAITTHHDGHRFDGDFVVTDSKIRLWNMDTGKFVRAYEGHTGFVKSVSLSKDACLAVSGSMDGTCRLWDIQSGNELKRFSAPLGMSCSFCPDGESLAYVANDYTIRLWDIKGQRETRTLSDRTGQPTTLVFSPDGKHLASFGSLKDKMMRLWDVERGSQIYQWKQEDEGWFSSATFSHDGERILVGTKSVVVRDERAYSGESNHLRLFDTKTGLEVIRWRHPGGVLSVAISPDDQYAVSGSMDGIVTLWRLPKPERHGQ